MALKPVSGEPSSAALLSLSLLVYTGHQALSCANLGRIVEKANALNAEGAEVAEESPLATNFRVAHSSSASLLLDEWGWEGDRSALRVVVRASEVPHSRTEKSA